MTIKKQFENITIQEFEEKYRQDVVNFELSERQQIYSSLPKSVLDDALTDENRVANIAINEYGDVVGFFVLHQYYQHEGYDTPENVVYVRSLSINEKFQGNGYGTTMMMYLPQYVQDLFLISITCIWLSMLKIKVLGMCMNVLVLCTLLLKKKVLLVKNAYIIWT